MSKPIQLNLEPDELRMLAGWAHTYFKADREPLDWSEAKLAMHIIDAHARWMAAASTGQDTPSVAVMHLDNDT